MKRGSFFDRTSKAGLARINVEIAVARALPEISERHGVTITLALDSVTIEGPEAAARAAHEELTALWKAEVSARFSDLKVPRPTLPPWSPT